MSIGHSPSVVTSGLVFYYDMNNTQKSWKGRPVTNLVDSSWTNWVIDGSGQSVIGTRLISNLYECTIMDNSSNTRQNISIASGISAGTNYTFSVKYKRIAGTPSLRFQIQAYNGASYLSTPAFPTAAQLGLVDVDGWQTAKITVTTPATTNKIVWWMQDGDDYTTYTHAFKLANAQCELGDYATPFVAGSRSNTQAIVDLTNNNTVTANSLTYASDGTFSFNGSSDRITASTSLFDRSNGQELTVSCWIKPSRSAGQYSVFCTNRSDDTGTYNWIFYQHTSDGAISFHGSAQNKTTYIPALNTWINVTNTVKSNGDSILYANGNPVYTATGFTYGGAPSRLGIGANPGGQEPFQGSIGATNIYDRALSASEVKQNFNAMRRRYGI